ncbi:ABC transporter permease [Thermophilibacter provencensis]|uniref:ABC transporter permease subunit n=1 Tax=Thermophilibacter provencensis TaxID=1852386 RepID=A0ABT7V1Z8_9ACTN|nr:ABC transporter permease subunit [Thermophilibacter provencensis]MDM8270633.1 ABC transporter permease subunit [Thermophilibacter provencensis]
MWGVRLLAVCFWLLVWQLAAWAIDARIILVGPLEVLARLAALATTGEFWASVGLSLGRIALGLVAGIAAGVVLAAAASRVRVLRELLAPLVGALKAVPVASFVILVLLWVSSSSLSIVIAWIMAFPIVYANVLEGIEQTDSQLLEMADVFGVRPLDRLRLIYLSQVLPYFRVAVSLALGLSWKAGIAAEVIGLPDLTIGEHLYDAKVYLDTPDLFAWTVAIVVVSVALEAIVGRALDAALARWEARP